MVIITGILAGVAAALSILGVRTQARVPTAHLGWMSEQWLAEHRAAHPSQA